MCEEEESCVSTSITDSSFSSRSSDWKHVYQEIRKEVELSKQDQEAIAQAKREAEAGQSIIRSKQITTLWMKVKSTKYLSLINGHVVVYNNDSWLLLYDLDKGTRSVFSPQPVEKNNGVGYHVGHATLDVLAVAEVSVKPQIFLVHYPSMETIAVVSDNTACRYDTLAFSGERMLLTLKSGLKLNISIWDWKSKVRYFNIERDSYSQSISLRGSGEGCLFSLLCLGKPSKLYLWEMSIFTDIVSLFSKHCSEDKDLDLRDQCLHGGNLYAVDSKGDVYKAHKESSDHLKFVRIIEGEEEEVKADSLLDRGPFIVGLSSGLAVYGPTQTVRFYKKSQQVGGGWVCDRTLSLQYPLDRILSSPTDNILIAWDVKRGLIKIGQNVELLEDRRILTDELDYIVVVHPEDVILATLLDKRKIQFWTIDEGYFVSEFVTKEDISLMECHPMVPYLAVLARSIGDVFILDVQNIRRPRLHKIIRVTFEPLISLQFSPKGDFLVAASSNHECLYLIVANPAKSFEVLRAVVTRYTFSSLAFIMGSSGHEWIVLLLSSYRNSCNRYLELLTLPNLAEFIKIDLVQSISEILTYYSKPSCLISLTSEDVSITRLTIDTRRGRLGDKVVIPRMHVVPRVSVSQDMFHLVSYGKRDGYLILYTPIGNIVLAPHRFTGIRWAAFATKSRCFITFTRDNSLACFSLTGSCGHEDSEHIIKYMPYRPLPYSKAKLFRKIPRDDIPWDENEDNQKKILIYKKGMVRTIGKGISTQELLEILNNLTRENKIRLLRTSGGSFDPDIIIEYINKWICHYRIQAKKFVEYNEFLEAERPAEMIPWEMIREVESRAYTEYKNGYDQTLAKFMHSVESSIERWTTAYNRIIATTWESMEKQPTSIKMIFRDFSVQSFGFKKGYQDIYKRLEDRITQAYMDFFLHQASENFIWDARFEIFDTYWDQYQKYLREGVESSEDLSANQKRDSEVQDEEGPEEEEYLVQDLSRYLDEQEPDTSALFKRRMLTDNLASYSSIHRLGGTIKRGAETAGNIMLRRGEPAIIESSLSDMKAVVLKSKESDESLFHDSDEQNLSERPRALKKYKKNKKRVLKRLVDEYPYLDEVPVEAFNNLFKIPMDYPDDCVFLRPGTHLAKATESEEPDQSMMIPTFRSAPVTESIVDDNPEEVIRSFSTEEVGDEASVHKESESAIVGEDIEEKQTEELENLIHREPVGKTLTAKQIIDSENEAALLAAEQLAKQMKKSKKSKKEVIEPGIEATEILEEEMLLPTKADDNRQKRAIVKREEKTTDKLKVLAINEQLIKKEVKAPSHALAVSDLSRLYLILDVDVLIESNRKRRKRRKSSLNREAMNKLKLRVAESKNERMTRLLNMVQDGNQSLIQSIKPKKPREQKRDDGSADSEESDDVIDLGKARAFLVGAPLEDSKEIRKKVLILGDIIRFKKRRLILGRVTTRTAKEKLMADLVRLGIQGPILPPSYVILKRQNILTQLNEERVAKEDDNLEGEIKNYTEEELCWLESALKKFEEAKTKKVAADVGVTEEEEERPMPEVEDTAFSIKTKLSILSSIKGLMEAERMSREEDTTKKEKPKLLATANIETVEEGMAYLMEGTVASNYVDMGLFSRRQLNLPSSLNMVTEIAHDSKAIFEIYSFFNDYFEKLRKVKQTVMTMIQKHQTNYHFYIKEIQEACKENPVFPEMPPAIWSTKENPEMMISVSDEEVPVSRYFSPSELSLKRRHEEEEALKRRQPKPDAFRLEALQIMMDGVVERRWEDELKKDIPFPKALVGKDPENYDPDEIALSLKYEEDVKFHNSERQRYKQMLMDNINKEVEAIRELHLGFDLRVKQMSEKLTEFIQISKELQMFSFRRFRDKAMQMAFLKAAERARTFTEATKASVDQIESLVKALGKKMRTHKSKMSSIKKKKEQREEKLEETLKKMSVISSDRSFVIMNYIRPVFAISPKFLEAPNLLSTVLDCFDAFGEAACHTPLMTEFFKDVANSLKRNVPQKLTKQIWEILAQIRRENIRNDIEIAILQLEFNKAEDAAKFFKAYLKQKQSFTEMISKAIECSVQRYKTAQFLQEYQIVLPMGMVEIEIGWEQEAKMPTSSDLVIMPAEDYEKLLHDIHVAEISLKHQQWKNSVSLDNIARLSSRHYELIARNQVLSLNIKHIERYQPSMHSRSLIKEIKESGLRLGGEKTAKRMVHSVLGDNETQVKREREASEEQVEEDLTVFTTNKHFILFDSQNHEEEFPTDPEAEYPNAALETAKPKETILLPRIEQYGEIRDDLNDEEPFKYLFDQNFKFQQEEYSSDKSRESNISVISKISRYMQKSKTGGSVINVDAKIKPTKKRTIDKRHKESEQGEEIIDENFDQRKDNLRKVKKVHSQSSLQGIRLSKLREKLLNSNIKKLSEENKKAWDEFMNNMEDMMRIHSWKMGSMREPVLNLGEVGEIELEEEEKIKERSEFQLVKEKYIQEAKKSIQRNNEIWYPKLTERDAELFKKDTGIDFDKYMEVPKDVEEIYDYDEAGPTKTQEALEEAPSQPTEEPKIDLERKKREFAFTGSWPERLVSLWKELEGADQATKQLEKLIHKSKKPSLTDYWNYSDFNFKRNMKNNLVSLLKSYKKQVERYWRDSKAMEREMTRYIEMNKRCVLLFFNYELSQTRDRERGAQLQEMTQRAQSFLTKRNIKVEKAMKKAELLRAIQQNQYEILQLQSELELIQLRTYPILMYRHV